VLGDDHISNCNIQTAIAQVYSKLKDYENAILSLSSVWEIAEAKYGKKSEEVGKVYLELAKVFLKKKDFDEAIGY
jgi:hypothetical protein